MLKLLRTGRKTTAASMADRSIPSESFDEYDVVVDDLSAWEFINLSSSDDEEEGELDDFSLTEEEVSDEVIPESKEESPLQFGSPSSDISMGSPSAQLHHHLNDGDGDGDGDGGIVNLVVTDVAAATAASADDVYANGDGDDCDDDFDDGYDLDDELVPWDLIDKFGRQRIRKLGKRACPRMNKAKRLPYRYNRPGCVHGKHGFGVQHSYI